ncbi:hypothetical protein HZF13_05405 [Lactiplantibacillus plantarum]|uniref:hypothetical protein n=1 Tax=Lactiplantibacillus plantarum TaxID=1590 RepID=UPI001CA5ECE4|nr:hypothetical protein [Lactiplantibacillus plantarum]QYC98878.1 hypothetical protein HZF13_05405 [Lactiplantibacillus plantarum]
MDESNKVFLSPITDDFFDDIAILRRSGEFLVQYGGLSDDQIINRYDDGSSKIYELDEEVLKPIRFKRMGEEFLITYDSQYTDDSINIGRIKEASTNTLLKQMRASSNPLLVLIIRGGRYKHIIHDVNNTPVVSMGEDPYQIEIRSVGVSNAAYTGQNDYSPTGFELAKSGQLIRCENCSHILKGERFCRYCEIQIKYPGEVDGLDRLSQASRSMQKAGDSMSKAGHSMTLGCTIPILLVIIIGILLGIL